MSTILIVDDDSVTRTMLERLFESSGFAALSAENGESAISLLRLAQVAMMVLDIRMPGMDGLETLRRIRANSATEHQAVVVYTAIDDDAYRAQANKLNATDYWIKGRVVFSELEQRVRALLATAPSNDSNVGKGADITSCGQCRIIQ